MKQEADASFLDLSSSGYREGSAFGGDNDGDDDDDDDFWGDAASSVSSAKDKDKDIFASSSDEDEREDDVNRNGSDGNLSDIFWNSSDESK